MWPMCRYVWPKLPVHHILDFLTFFFKVFNFRPCHFFRFCCYSEISQCYLSPSPSFLPISTKIHDKGSSQGGIPAISLVTIKH